MGPATSEVDVKTPLKHQDYQDLGVRLLLVSESYNSEVESLDSLGRGFQSHMLDHFSSWLMTLR